MNTNNVIEAKKAYDSKKKELENKASSSDCSIRTFFTILQIPLIIILDLYVLKLIANLSDGFENFVDLIDPRVLVILAGLLLLQVIKRSVQSYYAANFAEEMAVFEREYAGTVTDYEQVPQILDAQFQNSQYVKEIIAKLSGKCLEAIASANRSDSVEQLDISYSFEVYPSCVSGRGPISFHFSEKRFKNLDEPLERAALARVIGAGIAANVETRYPKDISGTERTVELSTYRGNTYESAVIRYTAQNGNYRPLTDWN